MEREHKAKHALAPGPSVHMSVMGVAGRDQIRPDFISSTLPVDGAGLEPAPGDIQLTSKCQALFPSCCDQKPCSQAALPCSEAGARHHLSSTYAAPELPWQQAQQQEGNADRFCFVFLFNTWANHQALSWIQLQHLSNTSMNHLHNLSDAPGFLSTAQS